MDLAQLVASISEPDQGGQSDYLCGKGQHLHCGGGPVHDSNREPEDWREACIPTARDQNVTKNVSCH